MKDQERVGQIVADELGVTLGHDWRGYTITLPKFSTVFHREIEITYGVGEFTHLQYEKDESRVRLFAQHLRRHGVELARHLYYLNPPAPFDMDTARVVAIHHSGGEDNDSLRGFGATRQQHVIEDAQGHRIVMTY